MALQFTQNEVEKDLADIVKHSDRREIARITQIYESVIYGMFNPDDERKSHAFGFLQIQCALDEIDAERGEAFWQKICEMRELSKKRRTAGRNLAAETGKLSDEINDVMVAHITGKPLGVQLSEAFDVQKQIQVFIETIIEQMNLEREKKD